MSNIKNLRVGLLGVACTQVCDKQPCLSCDKTVFFINIQILMYNQEWSVGPTYLIATTQWDGVGERESLRRDSTLSENLNLGLPWPSPTLRPLHHTAFHIRTGSGVRRKRVPAGCLETLLKSSALCIFHGRAGIGTRLFPIHSPGNTEILTSKYKMRAHQRWNAETRSYFGGVGGGFASISLGVLGLVCCRQWRQPRV